MSHEEMISFGQVGPAQLYDDEQIIFIFDPTQYIIDHQIDLKPFNEIVTIITDQNLLLQRIEENTHKRLVIIFILPQWTHAEVQSFILQQILPLLRNTNQFSFFYIDGQNFAAQLMNSRSITSRILAFTQQTCRRVNTDNLTYYGRERNLNHTSGNIGIANSYAIDMSKCTRINLLYNQRLQLEFAIRHLQ